MLILTMIPTGNQRYLNLQILKFQFIKNTSLWNSICYYLKNSLLYYLIQNSKSKNL